MRVEKLVANLEAVSTGMRLGTARQDAPRKETGAALHDNAPFTTEHDTYPDYTAHTRRLEELES